MRAPEDYDVLATRLDQVKPMSGNLTAPDDGVPFNDGTGMTHYPGLNGKDQLDHVRLKTDTALAEVVLRLETLTEFVQQPKGSSQIPGLDPGHAIVIFYGAPKGGKTFSVCDLTLHAAHGLDWYGFRIIRPLRVAYLAGEGLRGLRIRLKGWLEYHDSVEPNGNFCLLPHSLSLPERFAEVLEILRAFQPDIIVVDTLNAYFGGGDENSTKDMTGFCSVIRHLRDTLQCSVYVIHHSGWGEGARERGSIVLRATADVMVQVGKDEGGSGLVGFQIVTGRDVEAMEAPLALRLVAHPTEWRDEDGSPLVTCVVQSAGESVSLPGRKEKPLGPTQALVLKVAREMAQAAPRTNGNGEVVLLRHDIGQRAQELQPGLKRQSVHSAWQPLHNRKLLRMLEPGSVAIRVKP